MKTNLSTLPAIVKPRRLRKADNKIIETDSWRGESHFKSARGDDGSLASLSVASNVDVSIFDDDPDVLVV